jgi:Lon protease-like protein
MLPPLIPLFPLPTVVLFPNVFLPLHIFEPRYRAMVADALAGDRIIGMALLQPGFEATYEATPPVFPVGCAGVITHSEALPDGRFNIVLRGIEKFRISSEDTSLAYRRARVEPLDERVTDTDRAALRASRRRLEALLAVAIERTGAEPRFPPSVPDEDLVNALAQYLDFEPIERQALLERTGVVARCQGVIELLEIRTLTPRGTNWKGRAIH